MKRLKSDGQHINATTTTVCTAIPAASHHSSLRRKNRPFLRAKAALLRLIPNQLRTRIKIVSLVITQIAMASVYSRQRTQEQFPQVPRRNAAMERTALVDTIKERVHITEALRGG